MLVEQPYEYTGPCVRYLFKLGERQFRSSALTCDLMNILASKEFFPAQPFEIYIGLCEVGLKEAKAIDWPAFRQLLAKTHNLNPSARIHLVSYHDLRSL